MRQFFLRVLAFLLGIKYKTPEEMKNEGGKLIQRILLKRLSSRIALNELKSIWLIGVIAYSESKAKEIKEFHEGGGLTYNFVIPTDFNFEGDYIDFYQVSTRTKHYLIAMSYTFSLSKEDDIMMFFETNAPYSTSHLDKKFLYYSSVRDADGQ